MNSDRTCIRIGVSGHRFLEDVETLESAICEVLETIRNRHEGAEFLLYSPLAVGADQLAAQCALAQLDTHLAAVLPMPLEYYLRDFTEEQKGRFLGLYKKSEQKVELPFDGDREAAYLNSGKFILENSDYLVAVWNGREERGEGGTAQIVRLARESGKPLAWVRAHNAVPDGKIPLPEGLEQGSVSYENW